MKLFIIAFAFIVALCRANFEQPGEFLLLDPGFLARTSWAHQVAYHNLQDEIDGAFVEINKIVANALAGASTLAIQKYKNFSVEVLAEYDSVFVRIEELPFNDCRTTVTNLVQNTVIQSGFISHNCFTNFSKKVQDEADYANEILSDFSGNYSQVVLNVYRTYVGKNAMTQGEKIEASINNTFSSISAEWQNSKPSINQLRTTLNANINNISNQLNSCFTTGVDFAKGLLDIIILQVETCEAFNVNNRNSRLARNSNINGFRDYTPEFDEYFANFQPYAW